MQRCARRVFLCGEDRFTGQSFEHRRGWIRDRLEFLSSVFAIDCLTYTVLSNHLHIVLRSRADVVAAWSDEEVAQRWLRLFPVRRRTSLDVRTVKTIAPADFGKVDTSCNYCWMKPVCWLVRRT